MIDYRDYEEKTPYKKKSKKKSYKRSDHKHEYVDIIGKKNKDHCLRIMGHKNDNEYSYVPAKRCSICGKAEWTGFAFTKEVFRNGRNYHQMLFELEDIQKEYPELEIIEI